MRNSNHTPKRQRGAKAVPVLGAAGLLSLGGGAFAATTPVVDLPTQKTAPDHEIILGEEELSDVSLSTFYVFDKESAKPQLGDKLAWRGCGGCRCGGGCRCAGGRCGGCGCGWRGCGGCGCGGCGCCLSWGRCGVC
jgi:hypothetical protein